MHDFDDDKVHDNDDNDINLDAEVAASMGEDFDDFTQEQENAGDDDFGDFDDGFQEPEEATDDIPVNQPSQTPPEALSVPPLVDFDTIQTLPQLITALEDPLDQLFPAFKEISSLPPVEPIRDASAIFSTERSLSLWSQLVAPPPLQPQNWVKSRIRRLFLVSLGVPVDLDEILPASKQKKLVLPSINLDDPEGIRTQPASQTQKGDSLAQNVSQENATTASTQGQRGSRGRTTARRGEPPPPPELDLLAIRRLCVTTDAALDGLTDEELKVHVKELQDATLRASAVLEYWLKRRDGLVGEKEAFEGVIENLVSHARRVRR